MSRSLKLAVLLGLFALASVTRADKEPVTSKIQKSKETFEKHAAKFRDEVLKSLKTAAEAARKKGDAELLDRIKQETGAFELKGTLPAVVSTIESQKKIRRARGVLETVYIDSIRTLTKSHKDDEADALKKELTEFQLAEKICDGKHYYVVTERLSWHDAEKACKNQGGQLAIVRTESENRFLMALMKAAGCDAAFLGATDKRLEGQWQWVDDTVVNYSNWDREHGQPNNNTGTGEPEHYAAILLEYQGQWWDVPGSSSDFICQWD